MKFRCLQSAALLVSVLGILPAAQAASPAPSVPTCYDDQGNILPENNAEVLAWKAAGVNSFEGRGHILGTVIQDYPIETGHTHFEVSIGPDPTDTIEVIYNNDFGPIPVPTPGMPVEACGDYVTADSTTGGQVPSPDGALIHWIHMNPDGTSHPGGYVVLNNQLCGQVNPGTHSSDDYRY